MEQRRYLKHKTTGAIYSYHERMANHPDVVEVNERDAFPTRFAPKGALERESKVDISIPEEIINSPVPVAPELTAQRGKTFGPSTITTLKAPRRVKPIDAGL